MTDLQTIFELNHDIITFVYGLAFFVLGLAIALQSRQHSRLELARTLPWLAAFGFTHSFYEWGDLFIPIQATYLSSLVIELLQAGRVVLLAISFACLFEFGICLLRPKRIARFLYASFILFLGWAILSLMVAFNLSSNFVTQIHIAAALARYLIGFPGALIAAYGLRRHTFERIAPLNAPRIVRMLQVAVAALGVYAILGGLIPPPVPFFPGNWINTVTFDDVFDIPPQIPRSLVGFVLAFAIIRALEIFELETVRFIEAIEQQQILTAERERIARELHDGVIQKVYSAGLLVESAQKKQAADSPTASRLRQALDLLNDAIADLRRNLGALRAEPLEGSLSHALQRIAHDPRLGTMVDVTLELDLPEDDLLVRERAEQVLAILREALSNVARHAHARRVHIRAVCPEGHLLLTVQDDGVGLPPSLTPGLGLRNIRDRARLLGGEAQVTSEDGKGTKVQLLVPWGEKT